MGESCTLPKPRNLMCKCLKPRRRSSSGYSVCFDPDLISRRPRARRPRCDSALHPAGTSRLRLVCVNEEGRQEAGQCVPGRDDEAVGCRVAFGLGCIPQAVRLRVWACVASKGKCGNLPPRSLLYPFSGEAVLFFCEYNITHLLSNHHFKHKAASSNSINHYLLHGF